jgi:CHAT domain-containing protein
LFVPLLPAIEGCEHLYLAPDGAINRVPFDLLGAHDKYVFHYLITGRDLLRFSHDHTGTPGGPSLVIADPDFDSGSSGGAPMPPTNSFSGDADRLRGLTLRFSRLPGALEEGRAVAARLGIDPVVAEAATETVIRNMGAPNILHIATHGYYFQKPRAAESTLFSAFLRLGDRSEHPLMRSGLVFAGVNRVLDGGSAPDSPQDGILNALDVAGLPLHGTRLVVLSCCFSGGGDIEDGEGVAGLRRSFIMAGAQAIVCSLWEVPDHGTYDLMVTFYDALKTGLGAGPALQIARNSLRERGCPPNAWAAFVCVGNPNATL